MKDILINKLYVSQIGETFSYVIIAKSNEICNHYLF